MLDRAHVVEAVSKLDQDHPDVIGHGDQHLAEVFRLRLLIALEMDLPDLRDPFHQPRNILTEFFFDLGPRPDGVLNGVMHETRDNRRHIQPEGGENFGHGKGMRQVRLPGTAELSLMRLRREVVRPANQFHLGVGVITPDLLDQLLNADGRGQHAATSSARLARKSLSRSCTPSVPFQVLISRPHARSTGPARGNSRNAPMP